MSGGGGSGNPLTRYVVPGVEALAGAVSEYFAPGNPIGTTALTSGVGQLAGGAAGGDQGQAAGGSLGGLFGGLGSSLGGGSGSGGGLGALGGLGGLGGLLGGGGGSSGPQYAAPFQSSGAGGFGGMQPAGSLGGLPFYSADQYANYGPNAPANSASFGPPVPPPPANLSPAGGGASTNPITGYLSAGGGGPATTPIDPNALSSALNAPTQGSIGASLAAPNASTGGGTAGQPWYANPGYWQGAGTVGAAYLKFLSDVKQPEFAKPFGSTVTPQQLNPLAGVRSSPIQPPQLVV